MDIGAGILIALWCADHVGLPLTVLSIFLGIGAALFPDLDVLSAVLPRGSLLRRIIGEHRGLLHRPFVYVLLSPLAFALFGKALGLLFTLGVAYHLIHDTFFLGYGVKWFWPFSYKSLSLFHDKGGLITSDILLWGPEDDAKIEAAYRTEDWIRTFYLRPGVIAFTEYPTLIVALVLLYARFSGQ